VNEDLERWFVQEILPHEALLMRFIARRWRRTDDLEDLRHETYVRVLESAGRQRPVSPCAFLLGVARNLIIDRIRRERIVSIDLMEDVDSLNVAIDEISPERAASGRQQLQRLAAIFANLPQRCREVVWMRRIEDLSQKEIASRLGIAESTVEKHLIKGIRLLADRFHGATGSVLPADVVTKGRFGAGR
jgi:RNA polymerase sigma factor (sigma-70 family)